MAGVCRFLESRTMYRLLGKVVVWTVLGVLAITVMDAITHPELDEDDCNSHCAAIVRYLARLPALPDACVTREVRLGYTTPGVLQVLMPRRRKVPASLHFELQGHRFPPYYTRNSMY